MYRLLIGSVVIGVLAFLLLFLIAPFLVPESDVVALAARIALGLSNVFYENMPAGIASYINHLNLAIAAASLALLSMFAIQLFAIAASLLVFIAKQAAALLHREKKEAEPEDLPAIDMDSKFVGTGDGSEVMGRGLDSIDQD